jgi:molybdopterin-guanine dinucleotide biosynthesis protein A
MGPDAQPGSTAALGVVLAGGRGRRLGRPKATAPLAGRALVEHPLAALREAGLSAVVVAKPGTDLPAGAAEVWTEPAEPLHPLCGIVHALERAGRPLVVVGCDLPFVAPGLLRWLAERTEPLAVAAAGGRLHPLLARYDPALAPGLRAGLERRRALRDVVSELGPRLVDEAQLSRFGDPALLTFNVNTPDDLRRAERQCSAGRGRSASP